MSLTKGWLTRVTIVLLLSSACRAQAGRAWTVTDCVEPAAPNGYIFEDARSTLLSDQFLQNIEYSCRKNGDHFEAPNECHERLRQADDTLIDLFRTSDVDLIKIYNRLFGCSSFNGVPIATTLRNNRATLGSLNETIYGSGSNPGLLKDLLTLLDGIDQVRTVAQGQVVSLSTAAANQKGAAENLRNKVKASADNLYDKMYELMQSLVNNRTGAQKQSFSDIRQSVNQAVQNIETQAEGVALQMANTYGALKDRYGVWVEATEGAITTVSDRASGLNQVLNQANQLSNELLRNLRTGELANVVNEVRNQRNSFSTDLGNAQTSIANEISTIANDLAKSVENNKGQFYSQLSNAEKTLSDRRNSLRSKIDTAGTVSASNSKDATQRAVAAAAKLKAMLGTNIQPLLTDVQAAMKKIVELSSAIDAIRQQTASDLIKIKDPAEGEVAALSQKISSTFSAKQVQFTDKFTRMQTDMHGQIKAKVSSGRKALAGIMGGVQTSQSTAAAQQNIQGQTAQDQAAASMTAAALVAAKQQQAADTTKAGLNTMVGVVGSALEDSQQTLSAISEANSQNVQTLNQQVGSANQATMQQAYDQVLASNQASAGRSAGAQTAGFNAELAGLSLEQEISQSGSQLESSTAFQNRKAQSLLADIQDIMNLARQNGGTLQDQMKAFEQQSPALFAVLQQKITAYKSLLVSQGQQAQVNAANGAAGSAQGALGSLATTLQAFGSGALGVSPSLAWDQSQVGSDSGKLVQDIQMLGSQLQLESSNGVVMLKNTAQAAMTQSLSQMKSASKDSAEALAALVTYNSALINQKRSETLTTGNGALQSALDAGKYLTTSAQRFTQLAKQFVADSNNLGGQASQNLTVMVQTINETLAEVTARSSLFMDRLTDASSSISGWSSQIMAQATAINAEIHQKAANVTSAIMEVAASSSTSADSLRQNIKSLQTFVDELVVSFNKQRDAFNEFAAQYSRRRIELIAGLNETVTAQRTTFMQGMTAADMEEAQRSGVATNTVEELRGSLEGAKNQGDMDMTKFASLMNKIGDGVQGLTSSYANKMGVDLQSLKQQSTRNAISSEAGIGGAAGDAAVSASLLAGQLADAVDKIGGSEYVSKIATSGASKDVYAIAGLLKNAGQETQNKVSALLRSLESGSMSFDEALKAARSVTSKDVNTVMDILNVFNQYVADHISAVYQFNASVAVSANALNATAVKTLADHVQVNAEALASMAVSQYKIGNLSAVVLPNGTNPNGGMINSIQTQRNATIEALEDYINVALHGSPATAPSLMEVQERLAPVAQIEAVLANASVPDAFNQVNADLAAANTRVVAAKGLFDDTVRQTLAKANSAVANILSITSSALKSTR
jgi:hypothetical protein